MINKSKKRGVAVNVDNIPKNMSVHAFLTWYEKTGRFIPSIMRRL